MVCNGAMDITFVLPGEARCGGVRVTVCMANQLLRRGHRVRIAILRPNLLDRARQHMRLMWLRRYSQDVAGWVHGFRGTLERFRELDDLAFNSGEIVVAVGIFTIRHVYNLKQDVLKVRYNHGDMLDIMTDSELEAWKLPMPTITVSSTITPDLERISGQKVLAVVPNGVDSEEYWPIATMKRDGIGSIFSSSLAKAPDLLMRVFRRLRDEFPDVPRFAFGAEKCPTELAATSYWLYPSVEQAREIYSRAKIWLVPSLTEGFPAPVLEAMACGCVVISTDSYGGRELIHDGENGLLVPRRDAEGFIRAIARILRDRELETNLAMAGMNTAAEFSWERAADKMEAFLEQLSPRSPMTIGARTQR